MGAAIQALAASFSMVPKVGMAGLTGPATPFPTPPLFFLLCCVSDAPPPPLPPP